MSKFRKEIEFKNKCVEFVGLEDYMYDFIVDEI